MKVINTEIEEVLIIEPDVFGDHRGWFVETYSKEAFNNLGIDIGFVQDNHSMSSEKGTLRGLHFQAHPKAQSKLVRCTKGEILDVAVDLRKGSHTYKKWVGVKLSETNKKQLFVPKGFAHGFLTITDFAEVQYKVDEYYAPDYDRCLRFDDSDISINWDVANPILSDKDLRAPYLNELDLNFSLKFMVTGADGQLGYEVSKQLTKSGLEVIAPGRDDFDLTDDNQITDYIMTNKPDVIIHCAAYTAVDMAEEEKELAYRINVEGTRKIAEASKKLSAKMVYISTDYVFDGKGVNPHFEVEETNPINYYGYTKEQGELAVQEICEKYFIVRTSWLYGINGVNFVKTMLRLSESKDEINVVDNQIGAPTYARDLAAFLVELAQTNKYGIYHGVNQGYCSWYDFAKAIFKFSGKQIKVNPINSDEFPTKAQRPLNSKLALDNIVKADLNKLPNWEDALIRFIDELGSKEDN